MKRRMVRVVLTMALAACAIQASAQIAVSGEGLIESTMGGFKFPDGTVQTSASASSSFEPVDMAGYQPNSGNYGGSCIVPLYEVPAGMRLVVELVSGVAYVSSAPADNMSVYISNGATVHNALLGQTIAGYYYLVPRRIVGTTQDQVLVSQQVRMYVQPGNQLQLNWSIPNYVVGADCWAHVTGYLEPLN